MITKKIIAIILMTLLLVPAIVGCGAKESSNKTTQEVSKTPVIIEQNEENLFELGSKQTKDIKAIVEKYGIETAYVSEHNKNIPISFSKDENDCGLSDSTGYTASSLRVMKPNDGGDNTYGILYSSTVDKGAEKKPYYSYDITMIFPNDQEFKLDNFKMFKDLVEVHFGDDYDLSSLESWIQEHIKSIDSGEVIITSERDNGSYREKMIGGGKSEKEEGKRTLSYRLTLRK